MPKDDKSKNQQSPFDRLKARGNQSQGTTKPLTKRDGNTTRPVNDHNPLKPKQ